MDEILSLYNYFTPRKISSFTWWMTKAGLQMRPSNGLYAEEEPRKSKRPNRKPLTEGRWSSTAFCGATRRSEKRRARGVPVRQRALLANKTFGFLVPVRRWSGTQLQKLSILLTLWLNFVHFWPQNCGLGCDGRIGRCLSRRRNCGSCGRHEGHHWPRASFGLPPGSPSVNGRYVPGYEPGHGYQYHGLEKHIAGKLFLRVNVREPSSKS